MKSLEIQTSWSDVERFCVYEDEGNCVFLFVPDRQQDDHWHIELTLDEVQKLQSFLNKFVEDKK